MNEQRSILLVEPFFGGSHQQWAEGFKKYSKHKVEILSLPAAHWKWRMHGAAVTLAKRALEYPNVDLIVVTDMLDLATFLALTRERFKDVPVVAYFHENQITYPWSPQDQDLKLNRDNHYGFINYTTALSADAVWFNSEYHLRSFLSSLPQFFGQFPDHRNLETVQEISRKSRVMHLGMDLRELDRFESLNTAPSDRPTILWNHRWEFDKNPDQFFRALIELKSREIEFNLVVLGQEFRNAPRIFNVAKAELKDRILHWGYVNSKQEYAKWLWQSDILPVTSYQDFFGGSILEAMYCNVKPLLPYRLAYPEHVPHDQHSNFFYAEGEFVGKLQESILRFEVLQKIETFRFAERYDWNCLIKTMDALLLEVIETSKFAE
ncbi:MAG: hypothetical protein RL266_1202 [Bacteroidota bacterium]|jgi:glycosyltransferase involved in cell wall biosynthesis